MQPWPGAQLEANGVHFPVKVLMPYHPSDAGWALEAQVAKQQLESLLGADFIEVVLEAGPSTGFISAVRASGRYCLMKATGALIMPIRRRILTPSCRKKAALMRRS